MAGPARSGDGQGSGLGASSSFFPEILGYLPPHSHQHPLRFHPNLQTQGTSMEAVRLRMLCRFLQPLSHVFKPKSLRLQMVMTSL